jgi:large subunit ribosomal protein L32
MPPLPKKKTPKSRQGKRRSHLGIHRTALSECPHCHSPRPSHQVCPTCGYYKGREAVVIGKPELPE